MNFKLKEFEQFAVVLKGCGRPLKTRQNFGQKPYKICKKNTENFKCQNIKWKYVQRTMMKKKLRLFVRRRRKIRKFSIPKNCGRRTTEEVTTTQTESSSLVGDEKEERKKKDSFNENL
jgi:hypothetical protein